MSKIGIESLGGHLLSDVIRAIKEADLAAHAAPESAAVRSYEDRNSRQGPFRSKPEV
jgi:hypothetical protein